MKYLKNMDNPKILDVGAGTGKYSLSLHDKGYDVTALELVKHNLRVIEAKNKAIKTILGNAIDLHYFDDNSFDMVLLFGPMYHLISKEEKNKALMEAKRVCKKNGIIMISYCMNDYAIIRHGFMDNTIMDAVKNKDVDNTYHINSKNTDLYSYVRLEDINDLIKLSDLKRINIISQDGPTDYIRPVINKMDEITFKEYIKYIESICERKELLGASSHVLDILQK